MRADDRPYFDRRDLAKSEADVKDARIISPVGYGGLWYAKRGADGQTIIVAGSSSYAPGMAVAIGARLGNAAAAVVLNAPPPTLNGQAVAPVLPPQEVVIHQAARITATEPAELFAGQSVELRIIGRKFKRAHAPVFVVWQDWPAGWISDPRIEIQSYEYVDPELILATVNVPPNFPLPAGEGIRLTLALR